MRLVLAVLVAPLMLASCGERAAADDSALHQALASGQSGAEVTFNGRLLDDPRLIGTHEHLVVSTAQGDRLEIDHNTDLARWVPAHRQDVLIIHGQLYIDSPSRQGVHCTHAKTSRSCPVPGWIEFGGNYYE